MEFNRLSIIPKWSNYITDVITCINNKCNINLAEISHPTEIDDIYLHTYNEIRTFSSFSQMCVVYRNTFAINSCICTGLNHFSHLISINENFYNAAGLTIEDVSSSVVLHELGHIFNNLIPKENESYEVRKRIRLEDELRADCFVSILGFKNEIIIALEKSLTLDTLLHKKDEFLLRINTLKKDNLNYLDGEYKKAWVNMS